MKRILPLLLALIASPLAAFIPFTNNVRIVSAGSSSNAAVASNGFEYLAAWTEQRQSGSAVYTVRIEADGTVDGPIARAVDPAGSFLEGETYPGGVSVTPGRDGYFLSWVSKAGLNAAITDSYGVIERRVTVPETASSTHTLAAWNGTTYLVLSGLVTTFSATLLDNNAHVIKADVPVGNTHAEPGVYTALVADDSGFLVVSTKPFDDHTDIYGRRINTTGETGEWFLIRTIASRVSGIAVVFDGKRDVVVWGDQLGIWTIPVDSHADTPGTARQWTSAIIYDLSDAIWAFDRLWIGYTSYVPAPIYQGAFYLTIAADGTVSEPVKLSSAALAPRFAASSARVLSVTPLGRGGNVLAGSFVTPSSAGPEFRLVFHQTSQQNGALTTDGKTLLGVWGEFVAPDTRIYASVVDTLHPDSSHEVQVSSGANDTNPVASFNGSEYLLVWMRWGVANQTEIVGRRLSLDGTLLGTEIDFGSGSQPRVASDGTSWIVIWQQSLPGLGCPFGSGVKLLATRVDPTGSVLHPGGIVIAPASRYDQGDADVTWSGSQYVVAWSERCAAFHLPTYSSISGATMTPDLTRINAAMVSGLASTSYSTSVDTPKVSATKDRILIAWNASERNAQGSYEKFIDYRLFKDSFAMTGGRQRSAVLRADDKRINGTLIALGHDPAGQFFILGRMLIPTASAYDGLYRWNLDAAGNATNAGLRFVFSTDERLMGTPLLLGPTWWMPESRFLPDAGAYRLFARDFQ